MMHAIDVEQVVGRVSPSPGVTLSIAAIHGPVGRDVAGSHVAGEGLVQELDVLDADVALQRQPLDGHDVNISVTKDAP